MLNKRYIQVGFSTFLLLLSIGFLVWQIRPEIKGLSLTIAPTITPTPTDIQPSEKALKIAAFAFAHISEKQKQELKDKHGIKTDDDLQAIREWAIWMDKDPVALARNEALMEKYKEEANKPKVIYNKPQPIFIDNSNLDTSGFEDDSFEMQNKINDLDRKIRNMESDQQWDCIRRGGSPIGSSCL